MRSLRRRFPPLKPLITFTRRLSRVSPPPPTQVIRITNNIARLGEPKEGPKPKQLLSLPAFPNDPKSLPGLPSRVTALRWVKHYFADVPSFVVHNHFHKGLVRVDCLSPDGLLEGMQSRMQFLKKISQDEIMKPGMQIHVPVSVLESRISRRFDTIPSATLNPNADEIQYLQRLVMYKDSAILVLNKPPRMPSKGNLPVHNSMDALAAAALSFGREEGPKLVHRVDTESSGLLLMGRSSESTARLHWLFTNKDLGKSSSKIWNDACEATEQKYWALVMGSPPKKQGVISAPLSKVFLNDGKMERIILAHPSGIEGSQEAVTEYRVLGPTIRGCTWLELRPLTGRKHQMRVHCAEALGTPIVGDYKYGWYMQRKWNEMPKIDYEPMTGLPYKMRRPEGMAVQKGSVLSKVPLLHLHCREMVIPNIAKFVGESGIESDEHQLKMDPRPDVLRFVAPMPNHMQITWNIMSSCLV
ncbi:hypothetical protein QJS10_CPA02g01573 [Acorus calamus]|uniref:Pseudouridine synthase RsuA/RluA-like domain-containing protein n=1 Tax=Acorus calamus TaxID=4465 RepID=A0AAV9FCF1_ACOCL|nr:hypothetical protein QJS10_CPA02g01573 [Acorus calamus]